MTEYPRKGDRVKVTYEGVVTKADDALHRFFEVDGISVPARGGVVEVTKRTFRPGTMAVRTGPASTVMRLRRDSGTWVSQRSDLPVLEDEDIRFLGYEIVYEPSA